ncbi:MAG: SCO family protein [Gaiellaceae bacterium]
MIRTRAAVAVCLLVALAASGCGRTGKAAAPATTPLFRGTVLTPPVRTSGFSLRDQSGKPVTLAGQRGSFVILAFLYTHCPDVCPLIADQLNLALNRLGPRRRNVRVLAVSVDPRRDTRAAVRRFVAEHRLLPQFRYLMGTRAQLVPVWRAYQLAAMQASNGVNHSADEMLIDPRGRGRVIYEAGIKAAAVLHDLGLLEARSGTPYR